MNMRHVVQCGAIACLSAGVNAAALAGGWSTPQVLSAGAEGFGGDVALDAAGHAVAVWENSLTGPPGEQIWASARTVSGIWKPHARISPQGRVLPYGLTHPGVRMTAAGAATAEWIDVDGVWTADKGLNAAWSKSRLLAPGADNVTFAMNDAGAAVLAWISYDGGTGTVMAMTRPADGTWGAPQVVVANASAVHLDGAAIGGGGDAVISWETYELVCSRHCMFANAVLHVSREPASSGSWQDSGPLAGPDDFVHGGQVAVDAACEAAVLINHVGGIGASVQRQAGAAWSALAPLTTSRTTYVELQTDAAADATMFALYLKVKRLVAIRGNLSTNHWERQVVIANNVIPFEETFGLSSGGSAIAAWSIASPPGNDAIQAAMRPGPHADWSAPTIAAASLFNGNPESIEINDAHSAVLVYSASDSSGMHYSEYADFAPAVGSNSCPDQRAHRR